MMIGSMEDNNKNIQAVKTIALRGAAENSAVIFAPCSEQPKLISLYDFPFPFSKH
jgi:hypothetical protein